MDRVTGKSRLGRNVGKLLIVAMAAYFIFTYFSLRDKAELNYYEVEEGSLVKEHLYRGLILREESVYEAPMSGTLYFFVADGRKAATGSRIYCIDSAGNVADYLKRLQSEGAEESDPEALSEILTSLVGYSRGFDTDDFSSLYSIDDALRRSVFEYSGLSLFSRSADEMASEGISFSTYYSDRTGTVCLYTDGYEGIEPEDVTMELVSGSIYDPETTKSDVLVESGEPVYKLITDENWYIVFPLDEEGRELISDGSQYRISFPDKGFNTVATIDIMHGADGAGYGLINMSSYLVQFTSERFVDFEIVSSNVSGLKVPDKSLTTKDFYILPAEYLCYDLAGNSGFYRESGYNYEFVITDIYCVDDEFCYIDCDSSSGLKPGDFVAPSADGGTLAEISRTAPLLGAYNINKGYTVFRRVEVLESSNGYSIIRKNTDYGLQAYDHIILDASLVEEGQLLYR